MDDSLLINRMQRRSSRRSVLFYGFLWVLCFVKSIENAPLSTEHSDSPRLVSAATLASGLQSKKVQEEEVGNPSEIAYQAWLLIDGHPDSQPLGGLDSANLLRRIKPKSIFVAPNLTACPEGYQDDTMNRCVKEVNIDHQAHKGFLVQRLQAIFGNKAHAAASSSSSSSSSSVASGPLQLNIPLIMAAPLKPLQDKANQQAHHSETTTSTTDSSKIEKGGVSEKDKLENSNSEDAIVTVYELNEDESSFFLGNKSSGNAPNDYKGPPKRPDLLVPVAEFVDDSDANLSGVLDYRIPENAEKENVTLTSDETNAEDQKGSYEETFSGAKEDEQRPSISPTLVLLLSPTKVPSIPLPSGDLIVAHNSSLGQVIIKMENLTGNATKEIIRVSVPEAVGSSSTEIDPDLQEDTTINAKTTTDFPSDGEVSTDSTEAYYEENYEESTETEDEEILKHSEAGMTVTLPMNGATVKHTTTLHDDKEPTGSSEISSEVSINDDFVRETTLVDFNVSKTSNSTSSESFTEEAKEEEVVEPDVGSSSGDLRNDKRGGHLSKDEDVKVEDSNAEKPMTDDASSESDAPERKIPIVVLPERENERESEESFRDREVSTEKIDSAETMIASSTNDAGTVVSPDSGETAFPTSKKQTSQPFRFETTTKIPRKTSSSSANVEGVYDYEPRDYPRPNPYGLPEDDGVPLIRTIDEQRYRPDNEDERFFADQQQQQHQQHRQHFVRFPSYDRHGRPNYVRFPSEEVNSIHPNDYKDRRTYNRYQQQLNYGRTPPSTKNSSGQEFHQKQSYWWLPPGWRSDNKEPETQQRSRSSIERSRTPMLLRFWTRMPLVRDPSFNYQHPTYPTTGRESSSARRVNYYKEMSTQDLNRAFAKKSPPSAIGG